MRKSLLASILVFAGWLATISVSTSTMAQKKASVASKIGFTNTVMGELKDEGGVHLGFTSFAGSDGSKLMVLYEDFGSSEAARNYLEKQIAKAVKLVGRDKKVDLTGQTMGERAEVLLRFSDGTSMPAVLRTDGPQFHEFYSSSRESLLQLEKRYMGNMKLR